MTGTFAGVAASALLISMFRSNYSKRTDLDEARGRGTKREVAASHHPGDGGFDEIAGELGLALAAGCRPLEALERCTQHRGGPAALRAQNALARIKRGLDPLVALAEVGQRAGSQSESALYAALSGELRSGLAAGPAVSAIARAASHEARVREADMAARAAPLVQLVVALGLVPSALLIGASVLTAGLGGGT